MLLLGIAVLATTQGSLDQKVSPAFLGVQARAVVKSLEASTNVPLEIAPPMSREVVVLKASNVSLSEAMEKLATVLHGKWFKTDHGYLLKRPVNVQRELEAKDRQIRADAIQAQLGKEAKRIAPLKDPQSRAEAVIKTWQRMVAERKAGEQTADPYYGSPAEQLAIKLALLIGAYELARSDAMERVTWSDKPNSAQRALPHGYRALLEEYRQTEEHLRTLADAKGPPGFDSWMAESVFGAAHSVVPIDKVIFAYVGRNIGGYCHVALYRRDGTLHSSAGRPFRFGLEWTGRGLINKDEEMERLKLTGKGAKLPLTPLAMDIHTLVEKEYESIPLDWIPSDKKLSEKAVEFLTQPEKHEPLSLMAAPAVEGLASARSKMLAACLTDEMYRAVRRCINADSIDLAQLEATLARSGQMEQKVDGAWLLLTPINPYRCETDRMGRDALGAGMRAAFAEGAFSLRGTCKMRYEGGSGAGISHIRMHYERIATRVGIDPFPAYGVLSEGTYTLLGSLSDSQWRTLEQEERLDCGGLTSEQRRLAKNSVFMFYRKEDEAGERLADIWLDPSESMPHGPHQGALIVVKKKRQTVLLPTKQEPPLTLAASTIDNLASFAASEALEDGLDSAEKALTGNYKVGFQQGYEVGLQVMRGTANAWEAFGPKKMSGEAVSYRDLPAAVRQEIEKLFGKYYQEWRRDGGGS